MIYWTAGNNSNFLNGHRTAVTERGAVRAARKYVEGELYGEGKIKYFRDGLQDPFRIDEKSIFTKFVWRTSKN